MSERNTFVRSLHDLGLAAWFGGNLMGAVGVNGAAAAAEDPTERLKLSAAGWGKWAPLQFTALVAHAIGGVGLIVGNRSRLAGQREARSNTGLKLTITLAAAAITLWSALVGTKQAKHADEGAPGATEAGSGTSPELTSAQKQQKVLQWVTPILTGILIVMGAQQGEQQRPVAGFLTHK